MIFLLDAENSMIVFSLFWTKHRNVTDRHNRFYSGLHCEHCSLSFQKMSFAPEKREERICQIVNNSAAHCPIALKVDILLRYGPRRPRNCKNPRAVKSQMADGAQIGLFSLNRNTFAADCPLSLKFGTCVYYGCAEVGKLLNL